MRLHQALGLSALEEGKKDWLVPELDVFRLRLLFSPHFKGGRGDFLNLRAAVKRLKAVNLRFSRR